jgi:hypothetical protein
MISRRRILAMAGAVPVFSALKSYAEPQESSQSVQSSTAAKSFKRMGGTPTAFVLRFMASSGSATPFDIVEHCHNLNLAGVQTNPPSNDSEAIKAFRERLEKYQMHLICDPRFPQQESDVAAFETQIKAFKEAGALACHAG